MKVERVSGGDDERGVSSKKSGRRSRVGWLRTTKAGREAVAAFVQYLSAGASVRSAAVVLGVSHQTLARWIRAGVDGRDEDAIWLVETIQAALLRSVANAEVRVFKANPLAWLRQSPASRTADSGWSEGAKRGSEGEGIESESLGLVVGERGGEGERARGIESKERGEGGSDSSSLSTQSKLAALFELRKAGLDLNSLIDSQLQGRAHYVDEQVRTTIESGDFLGKTPQAFLSSGVRANDDNAGCVRASGGGEGMMRGPGLSGGTPVENGPNDTNRNSVINTPNVSNPRSNHVSNTRNISNTHTNPLPTNPTHPITIDVNVDHSVHSLGTPTRSGTNTHPAHESGTPVARGTNPGSGTPNRGGSNGVQASMEILTESLLLNSGNDDTIQGKVAAILAAGRARASLSARKE